MNKYFNAIIGLLILPIGIKIFNSKKILMSKRIAIIGSADSAFEIENKDYIDDFDYVIRINKAIHNWKKDSEKFIGTKTDILLHNMYENLESGGGPIDFKLFQNHKISYLLNPKYNYEGFRLTFNFYKKYLKLKPIFLLDRKTSIFCLNLFSKPLVPTMGFFGLYIGLVSECEELFITGFTFFKTPYAVGYRDHLVDMKANEQHIKSQGLHNPDLEYNLFCKLLLESKVKKIYLDSKLFQILTSDNIKLPENIYLKNND